MVERSGASGRDPESRGAPSGAVIETRPDVPGDLRTRLGHQGASDPPWWRLPPSATDQLGPTPLGRIYPGNVSSRRQTAKWSSANSLNRLSDNRVLQPLPEMPNNYGEPTAFMVIRRTGLPLAAPNWFAKIGPGAGLRPWLFFPTSAEAGAGAHGSPAPLVQSSLR